MYLCWANCVVGVSGEALLLKASCGIPTFSLFDTSRESRIPTPGINYIGLYRTVNKGTIG